MRTNRQGKNYVSDKDLTGEERRIKRKNNYLSNLTFPLDNVNMFIEKGATDRRLAR